MENIDLPLVSIITPTFNQGRFIEETIRSVLAQTYPNIEYIVIDAMSSDNTHEILGRYKDKIDVILREADKGQSDAIVKGFKMAKGEIVGWINSDDLLYPKCIELIVDSYREHSDASIFYCSKIDVISESGSYLNTLSVPLLGRDHLLRECNTLIQPGSFYRESALKKINYFDTSLRYSMDLDLWLRLLMVGSFVDVHDAPIAAYREWGGTKTATGGAKLGYERIEMLNRHGGSDSDPIQKNIRKKILKSRAQNVLLEAKGFLFKPIRLILLFFYYLVFIHLPASNSKFTRWARSIRGSVCVLLFKYAGNSINIEKGAHFGSGKNIEIGDRSGLGINCQVMGQIKIGKNVMMGPDVVFISTKHGFERIDIPMIDQDFSEDRPVIVEDDVWIGARCIFLPGVIVGKGVVIGAGSVVTKSVPAYSVVAGNPARIIKSRK